MKRGTYKRSAGPWDKEKKRLYNRQWSRINNRLKRIELLNILGGKCKNCGFSNYDALEIDHIEPVLRRTTKDTSKAGVRLVQSLMNGKYDISAVQVLCANCHSIKTKNKDSIKFTNYNLIIKDQNIEFEKGWTSILENRLNRKDGILKIRREELLKSLGKKCLACKNDFNVVNVHTSISLFKNKRYCSRKCRDDGVRGNYRKEYKIKNNE